MADPVVFDAGETWISTFRAVPFTLIVRFAFPFFTPVIFDPLTAAVLLFEEDHFASCREFFAPLLLVRITFGRAALPPTVTVRLFAEAPIFVLAALRVFHVASTVLDGELWEALPPALPLLNSCAH